MKEIYDKKQVGLRLKEFRNFLQITQKDFASSLNCTYETYKKIENGKILITSDRLQQLHEIYNIDVAYILTGIHTSPCEYNDNTLLDIRLRVDASQWHKMNIRMNQYYLKMLTNNTDKK